MADIVAKALAVLRDKSYPGPVGFFVTNPELSIKIWAVIGVISGYDDECEAYGPRTRDFHLLYVEGDD